MLIDTVYKILKSKGFVYVATANGVGKPNAAPKFLIKIDKSFLYLMDYVIGTTWINLQVNPRASVTFLDDETLTGYQVNGSVTFISKGEELNDIIEELQGREISFTTERIVEGIRRGKKHSNYEAAFPKNGVVLKVKIEEVVEISSSGKLSREKVK